MLTLRPCRFKIILSKNSFFFNVTTSLRDAARMECINNCYQLNFLAVGADSINEIDLTVYPDY